MIYGTGGEAQFYCPEILRLTRGRTFNELKRHPETGAHLNDDGTLFDAQGHSTWVFQWDAGDYHITHPSNGIPHCTACGLLLIFISGVHPLK